MERAFLAKIATRFSNFKISNFCNNKTNKEFACPSDLQIRVTMQKILNQRVRVWEKWILSKNNKPCPSLEGDLVIILNSCPLFWRFTLAFRSDTSIYFLPFLLFHFLAIQKLCIKLLLSRNYHFRRCLHHRYYHYYYNNIKKKEHWHKTIFFGQKYLFVFSFATAHLQKRTTKGIHHSSSL